eukprot:COSAG02_NODE_20_length_53673_cov_86.864841_22_plen_582_part_00
MVCLWRVLLCALVVLFVPACWAQLNVDQVSTAEDASETELWAADRLAELLALPRGEYKAGASQIAIGYGAAVASGMNPAALDEMDDDSYLINTSNKVPRSSAAIIASSARSARGTIHGAFGFLRILGFEFFAENVTLVPEPMPTELPTIETHYSPSYVYRDLTMASPGIGSNLDRRHVRTKNCSAVANANHWRGGACEGTEIWRPGRNLSAALGLNGHWSFGPVGGFVGPSDPPGFVATAYNLMTPSLDSDASDCAGPGTHEPHSQNTICPAVFRQHPDWFTCGQPAAPCTAATANRTYNSQPCWSAPGVKDRMTQNILKILRSDPTVALISVSNMDGDVSYSPCPLDMVAAEAENATGAANFYLVRDIAASIASEFPKTKIEVLAYNGAWQPPKHLRFADNVVVRIAGYNLGSVSLYHPRNAQNLAVTKGWLQHAKTVYVWNEVNNGQILPHGDVLAQALHLKELASLGVTGYFAEGSALPGADMHDLRVFLAGRLTFNASLDVDDLLESFLNEYYGERPAQRIAKYIKLIETAFQTGNHSVDFTGRPMDKLEARYTGAVRLQSRCTCCTCPHLNCPGCA